MVSKYRHRKKKIMDSSDKKISRLKNRAELEKIKKEIPPDLADILEGVNIFQQNKPKPVPPNGPMICYDGFSNTLIRSSD